jgi:hypothetical protein
MKTLLKLLIILLPIVSFAQVDQIKSGSTSHRSSSSGGSGRNDGYGSSFVGNFFFNLAFNLIIVEQQKKLQQRQDIPTLVSLDVIAQVAAQPSSYYIINPRIRGNWGLFSTDYRMNYIIEEAADGVKHVRTNDWQVLELNLVTTPDFTFRLGAGAIFETYGNYNNYGEWTASLQYQPRAERWGGFAEYRGAEVRKEGSAFAQYKLFDHKALHGFLTMGATYQRFYDSITVWGFQGGFMCRVY